MASDITPDQLRNAQLRSAVWGADRSQAESLLQDAALRIEALEGLLEQARQEASEERPDLESEFDAVGAEVSSILQAAREAAEAMRERASVDAARWRTEAIADAEERRRVSAADAEAMRRDAWATGTQMIEQAESYTRRIAEQADRDVLTTMGEAEREAHRLTSAARREAEDLVRNATMTAEKMTAEAVKRRDEIIDAATKQASVAQERTLALEKRRDELLEELEHARSTLSQLEASLDQRREFLVPDSSVRVVPATVATPEEPGRSWESGETVRVVKPEGRRTEEPRPAEPAPVPPAVVVRHPDPKPEESLPADTPAEPEPPSAEPEPVAPEPEPAPPVEAEADPPPQEPGPPDAGSIRIPDAEVDSLFASLRSGGSFAESTDSGAEGPSVALGAADVPDPVSDEPEPDREVAVDEAPATAVAGHDWSEERDARLLPITNRALRGVKKSITELQNIALDNLRTDADWRPDPAADSALLSADLVALWGESFAAGHAVAELMSDSKLKRPSTPSSAPVEEFPAGLSAAVTAALDAAGDGQRERQSAASRVYRVWRSDEAEQRIRDLAVRSYRMGVELSTESVG